MFNVGGGEVLLILLLALIVLGPDKLPEFSRKAGNVMSQLRRLSGGFQEEMRRAMDSDEPAPAASPSPSSRDESVTALAPESGERFESSSPDGKDASGPSAA